VWSLNCFFVKAGRRASGVSSALIEAAASYAREQGATVLEGYPLDPGGHKPSNAAAFTGVLKQFERAGFVEVARRGGRPIVRRML
jgi:GNAT superfamily N-acetyltransferase